MIHNPQAVGIGKTVKQNTVNISSTSKSRKEADTQFRICFFSWLLLLGSEPRFAVKKDRIVLCSESQTNFDLQSKSEVLLRHKEERKRKANRKCDSLFFGSPCWARTSDTLINSQVLVPTELRRNINQGKPIQFPSVCVGYELFSRAVASQVSSPLQRLTSVFGMGTGGPTALK